MKIGEIWECIKEENQEIQDIFACQVVLGEKVKIIRLDHIDHELGDLVVVSESLDIPFIEILFSSEEFVKNFKKVYDENR